MLNPIRLLLVCTHTIKFIRRVGIESEIDYFDSVGFVDGVLVMLFIQKSVQGKSKIKERSITLTRSTFSYVAEEIDVCSLFD